MNAFGAHAIVATVCSASSILIALIGYKTFHTISDGGMWAITVATAMPMAAGLGIAYFINESQRSQERRRERRLPDDNDVPPGSFTTGR